MPLGSTRSLNLSGMTVGKLLVVKRIGTHSSNQALWECKCSCGNTKNIMSSKLIRGLTKSCGCLIRENGRKEMGYAAKTLSYRMYKKGAKTRCIEFSLTFDQFIELASSKCHYCGCDYSKEIVAPGNNGYFRCNGIDRVDSSLGYFFDNCVPCCSHCNYAKRDLSYSEFIDWIGRAYKHAFRKSS